ncbi:MULTISPECIES: hypothetical protein [unclassified Streptomyces]|uniref:hypothetical protein n=1 Tax=Streptomyces sp. NPDC127532 TaxID=3345399 RepID=UPI00363DD9C1
MPFEEELSEELRRTGETFDLGNRPAVVAGGLEAGVRRQRRRRATAVTGSVLALALIGVGGAFAGGLLDGSGTTSDVASAERTVTAGAGRGISDGSPVATGSPSGSPAPTPTPSPTHPSTATPTPTPTASTSKPPAPSPTPTPSASVPAGAPSPELDYTKLMPTFQKLLPKGLPVVEKGHEGGEYAYVVADDGKGRSLVQINVQRDMRDAADELYAGAKTLPDGTKLKTTKQPGEKGGEGVVWWTADTMRTDGMRVVVSAFNSGEQSTPATRAEPALTMKQLISLATSAQWLKLQQN